MRICLLVLATCVGSVGVAEDWQQFRGGTAGKLTSVTHPMEWDGEKNCLLYTSPSPRDQRGSRMPSSA